MKTKLVLIGLFIMVLPVMAQTNSPVSFSVEVPSFTIAFPNTMTLSQINDVLKTHFGTNLVFTFTVTNSQTHEQLRFVGNSMPNMDKLQQLLATQRQNHPPAFPKRDLLDVIADQYRAANVPTTAALSANDNNTSDIEERKTAALERQADALERQANALENQTMVQERAADAAEDQAFQQQMFQNDVNLRLDMSSIQSQPLLPIMPSAPTFFFAPIQQPEQTKLIILPGQVAPIIVPPARPGQPQLITIPGQVGPIIVPP